MAAAGIGRIQDFFDDEGSNVLEAVQLAIDLGVNVKAANRGRQTALHAAAAMGLDPVVQLLADKGADVNAKDRVGQTPWSIAKAISPVVNNQGALRLHESTADLLKKLGATEISEADLTSPGGLGNIRSYAEVEEEEEPAKK